MNYKLIMTEGSDELAFVNLLLDRNLLKFKRKDLLMEKVFHKRQIDGELRAFIQDLPIKDDVDIYRIGDKLSDKLKIPHTILIGKIRNQFKICIKPEFEILFILKEELYKDYLKVKSIEKPSIFYKKVKSVYKKQYSYVEDYFSNMTNDEIKKLLSKYDKIRRNVHKDDEFTINSIIR